MNDASIVRDIKKEIESRKKKRESEKLSIVCDHILFSPKPTQTVLLKLQSFHEKSDGMVFVCTSCSLLFNSGVIDNFNMFHLLPHRKFQRKISTIVEV